LEFGTVTPRPSEIDLPGLTDSEWSATVRVGAFEVVVLPDPLLLLDEVPPVGLVTVVPPLLPVELEPVDVEPVLPPVELEPVDLGPVVLVLGLLLVALGLVAVEPVLLPVELGPVDVEPVLLPVELDPVEVEPVLLPDDVDPVEPVLPPETGVVGEVEVEPP